YLSDIKLLGAFKDIFNLTNGTRGGLINYWLYFVIRLIIFILLFILIKKYKDKQYKRNVLYIIPLILLIIFSLPIKKFNSIIKSTDILDKDYNSITTNIDNYAFYGMLGGMYYNIVNSRIFEPNNYYKEELKEIMNYQSSDEKEMDYNIIFILSESFYDISKIDEIKYDQDIIKDYHELKEKGKLVNMLSPTFGGKTGNVEFELLTGINLAYYDSSYIPYMYVTKDYFKNNDNLLMLLKKNNIDVTYYKNASESIYNVRNVYKYLGFSDKIKSSNNKKDFKGYYASDKYVTDQIIDYTSNSNEPFFLFTTTMQNHMPYVEDKYDKYDMKLIDSKLSKEEEGVLLAYSEGLYDASIELKRLYDYINTIDKKTIIIFIGDHLPYLSNSKGENIIDKLNYFNTKDNLLNLYRKYSVEALVLSNFDIDYDDTEYLSPDLLIPYVLKSNQTKMNSYYNYLIEKSKSILPSYNRNVAVDCDGKIYDINKLPKDMKKEYDLRNSIQYNLYYE
ncbi:MAG: LTA synthase family protein, partial [Bacilli bacterium]|nr:LTA synthase family protein [Bacilli bacterium]